MANDPHDKHQELLKEITSLKKRIMELEQSEKRTAHMASFPDLTPVSILEVDRSKQVIFCNPAMQSVTERTGIDDPSIFIPGDLWELFSKGEVTAKHEYAREVRIKDLFFIEHIFLVPEYGSLRVYATDITEHRKIKERLKKRDEMIKSLFDAVPETMIFIDTEGTVLLSNAVVARRLGKTISELEGTCIYDSFPPDVAINRKKHYDRVVSTGEPLYFEDCRLERYFEQYCYPVFDEDKKVSGVIIFAYEITERNKAEQALLAEKGFSESILEAMPGVAYCFDDHLHLIKYNRNFEVVTGYSAEELAKITPLDLFEGEGKRLAEERIREAFEKGESTLEADFVSKDGSKTPYFFTGKRVTIDNTQHLIGMGIDVTERKYLEQSLLRSERLLNETQKMSGIGGWEYDVKTGKTTWTDETYRIHGVSKDYNHDDIEKCFDFYAPSDRATIREAFNNAVEHGVPYDVELQFVSADGQHLWVNTIGKPLVHDGKTVKIAGYIMDVTARRKAEKALRESEEKYRSIFDNAVEGIFQTTPEGRFLSINPSFAKLVGYETPEEMIESITDLGHRLYVNPEDRAQFKRLIEEHGLIEGYETQYYRKDGSIIWVSINARCVYDENGVPIYYEGTFENITSRKQAEEELQERDIQFKKLSFWVPGMIYRFIRRPDGTYCMPFTTEAIKDIFGCSPQDVRDDFSPIAKAVLPEDLDKTIESIEYSAKHLNVWKCEYRVKIPGQPIRWLSGISTPEKLSDGSIIWYGFNTDITERKKAEEKLHESEAKYRSIFENAVEGIFQTTLQGKFLNANPAMARMLGYASPEELISSVTNIGEQLYANPEERSNIVNILKEKNTAEGLELHQRKKDGSLFWALANARTVKDETGNILYFEGTYEDITPRKLAEEKLKQTLEKLRKSLSGTIQALSSTAETRDPYTAGHQRRVSNLARTIASEMGLSSDTVDNIRMAGIIHDIGKISIPAELLAKPTRLTDMEMSLIKTHSQSGYDILKDVDLPYPIAEIVLQHHERLNGSGYPEGLKGDQILLETKILAVADVTEAIATHRPYRPALGIDVALDEIEKNKGMLYDEKVVEVCLRLFREKGFMFE